jgi:hypothetical protein
MCAPQLAGHGGRGVSVLTELGHRLRIAFTATGVVVLMGLSMFSSIAHADEASLEDLVMDPTASISVGSLKFDNFGLDRLRGDLDQHVEVTGITHPDGETGIRLTGDYEPIRFDLMGFTVTTVDPFALLHSMTLTFDANPLNPDIDSGSAWVTAFLFPTFFVFGEVMVCTQGTGGLVEVCGTDNNKFVDRTMFFDFLTQSFVDIQQVHVQVEVANFSSGPGPTGFRNVDITFSQVPEPSTLLLLATAAGIARLMSGRQRIALTFTKRSRCFRDARYAPRDAVGAMGIGRLRRFF